MSILNEMGIQQWRLRHTANTSESSAAMPELPTVNEALLASEPTASVQTHIAQKSEVISSPAGEVNSIPSSEVLAAEPSLEKPIQPQANQSEPVQVQPLPASMKTVQDPLADLDWQGLQSLVDGQSQCQSCGVERSLLGAGDPNANWLFVVDAPHNQDIISQQFLNSRAGQLFDAILSAVGLERRSIYMTSVFKCVASDDLNQAPNCDKILHRQIELIQPEVVIALGEFTAQSVIKANESLDILRQSEQSCFRTKVPIVPTFTPSQMLEEPALKAAVWRDLKLCLAISPTPA